MTTPTTPAECRPEDGAGSGTWQPIETAPKGPTMLVWDDYYLMRTARFDCLRQEWVTDLPYGSERGEVEAPLEPRLWMRLPPVPVADNGPVASYAPPQPDGGTEALRAALEWYAEQVDGCRKLSYIGDPFRHALDADGGKRARAALASAPAPGEVTEADDLRAAGWAVAVHNDYRLNGEPMTFWLFTRGNECVKGEGPTDAAALAEVRAFLATRRGSGS